MLAQAESQFEVAEYSPGEIKLAMTGYGSADKKQMRQMVAALLNLDETPEPDDAADALAVAVCHINNGGNHRLERLQ